MGGTWTEFGDNTTQQEWDDLVDFIVDNDMTVDANYDYVKEVYNTGSLIDYFILNSYVVAMDWLNWNTAWWKEKILRVIRRSGDMLYGTWMQLLVIMLTTPASTPALGQILVTRNN